MVVKALNIVSSAYLTVPEVVQGKKKMWREEIEDNVVSKANTDYTSKKY